MHGFAVRGVAVPPHGQDGPYKRKLRVSIRFRVKRPLAAAAIEGCLGLEVTARIELAYTDLQSAA
jgi:hypothetical protein